MRTIKRIIITILLYGFAGSLTAAEMPGDFLIQAHSEAKQKKTLQQRRQAVAKHYQQLKAKPASKDAQEFLVQQSFLEIFRGYSIAKLNRRSCQGLNQRMKKEFFPRPDKVPPPGYLYPSIALVKLVCPEAEL